MNRFMTLLLIVAAALPAIADTENPPRNESAQTQAASRPAEERVPIVLEGTDLARMLRRDVSDARFSRGPKGDTMFDLAGGFRSVLVMRVAPKGEPVLACVATEEEAQVILSEPVVDIQEP